MYHPQNVYAIHFDAKIPDKAVEAAIAEIEARVPDHQLNTYIVPRQLVTYDGVSIILSTLSVMSFLLTEVKQSWDFFINLSGSDYPLVQPTVPRKLLGKARLYDPLFFSFARQDRWEAEFRARASTFHVDEALTHQTEGGELHHVKARNPIVERLNFVPSYGEAWMIVHREFCEYVTGSETARKMLLTMGNMRGGDEHFFVTLAYNEERFNKTIVRNSLRKVVWVMDGKRSGQHPFYLDEREEDGVRWKFLEKVRNCFAFHARKFRTAESEFMDVVDGLAKDEERIERVEESFERLMHGVKRGFEERDGSGA